jgi:hypothetical protein
LNLDILFFNDWKRLQQRGVCRDCSQPTGKKTSSFFTGELKMTGVQYRGLFVGSRGAEWVGHVSVCCQQTDLVCKLHFKPLGWLGLWGCWHNVEVKDFLDCSVPSSCSQVTVVILQGHVKQTGRKQIGSTKDVLFTISGQWDKHLYLNDAKTGDKSSMAASVFHNIAGPGSYPKVFVLQYSMTYNSQKQANLLQRNYLCPILIRILRSCSHYSAPIMPRIFCISSSCLSVTAMG